ncbi:YARHG domain-containing protein [Cronbergia sp. UHCC 0137]|uniref:protein kinase domain-containing protein n=1 Tax=Cronbergia sp. UHCC 0137 TaxID=3110239 RepID=UPI002B211C80|nr:YARHG domain-containing protein [Cronbergia sp. UHCC 0137]MEA5621142.1 YARHG domain-containing protein [Cronbergia sp. UHCC 0137]
MTIKLLNDRYQVIQVLGSGGFGDTFLAEDTYMPSRRRCVVKQLKLIDNNPQIYQLVQERFQREAAILEALGGASDQIPALYAYFCSSEHFYLVQEWVEGDTLRAKTQKQGFLTDGVVKEILINLLPVLDYVHSQKIIHRDIKPDNIIVRYHDNKPVLIDFGAVRESMATVVNSQGNATSSIVIGTPGFMPSEQAAGRPVYSSDLYSLGLTAIYLLTGKQPQELETDHQTGEVIWREYGSDVNPIIADVIDKAIAYHPRDRYPTAKAMLEALQNVAIPVTVKQPSLTTTEINPTPAQPTITITRQRPTIVKDNNQKGILILIASVATGLISMVVIVGQMVFKFPQSVTNREISSSSETITNPQLPTQSETPISSISKTITNSQLPTQSETPISSISKTTTNSPPPENSFAPLPGRGNRFIRPLKELKLPPIPSNYVFLFQRPITDADLNNKDGFELDIMRNMIFAVHGRQFNYSELQEFFNQQPWYRPQYSPKDFPMRLLSKMEIRNAAYIANYQDRTNRRYFPK